MAQELIFKDATSRSSEIELLDLLALAVGDPTAQRLAHTATAYRCDPARRLFALLDADRVVTLVGVHLREAGSATILHLAVRPDRRRLGLGRQLMNRLRQRLRLSELVAETNQAGVGFYEGCGFRVDSLGELYPGVERFVCRWDGQSSKLSGRRKK